jgi:hypothetical protein
MTCLQIDDEEINAAAPLGLSDILNAISDVVPAATWTLLELEGRGRLRGGRSVVALEEQISASPSGLTLDWPDFTRLAEDLEDVVNLLAAFPAAPGQPKTRNASRLAESHDVVLERFDSTYWRLYLRRAEHATSLRRRFPLSRECDRD